jgi:hypothetical protein
VAQFIQQLTTALSGAQMADAHSQNVAASQDAANREINYYGTSPDVGGSQVAGDRMGAAADAYTREAAQLPVHDAEAMARLQAQQAGGYTSLPRKPIIRSGMKPQ